MPSMSENISKWKQKSEIEYFSLFIPLWLAFDAWIKDHYHQSIDRQSLNQLKQDFINNRTYKDFQTLIQGSDSRSSVFKDYLNNLIEALDSANIPYDRQPQKVISFKTVFVPNSNPVIFDNILKKTRQHNKLKLTTKYIDGDIQKVYASYIEILYQLRCVLFHGNLNPTPEHERVVKFCYLTLKEITERI